MSNQILNELLLKHCIGSPKAFAIATGTHSCTYISLFHAAKELSETLTAAGFANSNIGVYAENSIEFMIAFFAIQLSSSTAIIFDPKKGPETLKKESCLANVGAILFTAQRKTDFFLGKKFLVETKDGSTLSSNIGFHSINQSNRARMLMFTSGSTGEAKAIPLFDDQLMATPRFIVEKMPFQNEHRELIIAPLSHMDGWQRMSATMLVGGTAILYDGPVVASLVVEEMIEQKVTGTYLPTPIVKQLVTKSTFQKIRDNVLNCRSIEIGSYPYSDEEITKLKSIFPKTDIYIHYGLTESSRATILNLNEFPKKSGAVGYSSDQLSILILDESNHPVLELTTGQIALKGGQTISAYSNSDSLNREKFHDGYLLTGDYGYIDESGCLYFQGRKDDLIFRLGHHLFLREIEHEIFPHLENRVFFLAWQIDSHSVDGGTLILVVEGKAESRNDFSIDFLEQLPTPYRPDKIYFLNSMLFLPSGKMDRNGILLEIERKSISQFWPQA